MDSFLTFAGLFSAIVVAFILETYRLLLPDQSGLIKQLFTSQGSKIGLSPESRQGGTNKLSQHAVCINGLFFASLSATLSSALFTMLLKLWIFQSYQALERLSSPRIRARTRQQIYNTIRKWGVTYRIAILSSLLQISLWLFLIGLVYLLFFINTRVAGTVLAFLITNGVFCVIYLENTVLVDVKIYAPITQFFQNLFRGMKRRIRSRDKAGDAGDEETAGGEAVDKSADDSLQRDKILALKQDRYDTLDVEIVVSAMEEADRLMEMGTILQCFEHLMEFDLVAQERPSAFFQRSILRNLPQALEVGIVNRPRWDNGQFEDAIMLCRFLDWYLSLRRTAQEEKRLRHHLTCPQSILPATLCRFGIKKGDVKAMLYGQIAACRLHHLLQSDSVSEKFCLEAAVAIFKQINKAPVALWIPDPIFFKLVDRYLSALTDCMSRHLHHLTGNRAQELFAETVEQGVALIENIRHPKYYHKLLERLRRQNYVDGCPAQRWQKALSHAIELAIEKSSDQPLHPTRVPQKPLYNIGQWLSMEDIDELFDF